MLIANQEVTSDRRRILALHYLAPSVLTPSGHGPLRPVRPDHVWCSSITSRRPLIYDSSVPTASGPPLLRSDCVGSMTLPPGCRFLLSERPGFAYLQISRPNIFTPCRPGFRIPRSASLPSWRLLTSAWFYVLYMQRPDPIVTLSDAMFSSTHIVYLV